MFYKFEYDFSEREQNLSILYCIGSLIFILYIFVRLLIYCFILLYFLNSNSHAASLLKKDRDVFFVTTQGLVQLCQRYKKGSRGRMTQVVQEMLKTYLQVETQFQHGKYSRSFVFVIQTCFWLPQIEWTWVYELRLSFSSFTIFSFNLVFYL